MSTETVDTPEVVEMTYAELASDYRTAVQEVDQRRTSAESAAYEAFQVVTKEAREKKAVARRAADAAYQEAVDKRTEMLSAAEKVYQEETSEANKAHAAACEEASKVANKERCDIAEKLAEGTSIKNARLFGWLMSRGVWASYRDSCELMLEFLDKKPRTLEEVIAFGRRDKRWCSTFTSYLIEAIEADVVPFEATKEDVAKLRFGLKLEAVGMYEEQAQRFQDVLAGLDIDGDGLNKLLAAIEGE